MKILVPLNNTDNIADLVAVGADEFYIGFYDSSWKSNSIDYYDLNRMSGFAEDANKYSLSELIVPVEMVHCLGKKIYVTLNSPYYGANQLSRIQEYLKVLKDISVDGVIASDIRVIELCARIGINAIASTMCGIYNSQILSRYVEAGVKRAIIPRDVSLKDVEMIVSRFPNIEYEVFMMRNGCKFSDSNCLGLHCYPRGALCRTLKRSKKQIGGIGETFDLRQKVILNETLFRELYEFEACGMCALFDFLKMKIYSLKIVGRAAEQNEILASVTLLKRNIEIAEKSSSRDEYLENMIFPPNKNKICFMGLSCYYPEIRFGTDFQNK